MSPQSRPSAAAQIVFNVNPTTLGVSTPRAVEGNSFAALGSLSYGRFTGNRTYNITLSRTILGAVVAAIIVAGTIYRTYIKSPTRL